jgi:threonine dehydrogenase-like Zn-dependent dehydrogenase
MKAGVLTGPRCIRLEPRPVPGLTSGWALLRVHAAGICGSDLHFYTGEFPIEPGSIRGHEIAGRIAEPGDTGFSAGQAVIVHPLVGCGHCRACLRGQRQLCQSLQAIGGSYPGGFAEYAAVPASNIYPFHEESLPFESAALADCVAVAVHAANMVGLQAGESAVVLGDGAIGLLLVQTALSRKAEPVILVGKHPRNLELASRWGASAVCDIRRTDALQFVRNTVKGCDTVFEAVGGGNPPIGAGLGMLRKGGRLAVLGLTGSRSLSLPWFDLTLGELSLLGVMGYGEFAGKDELAQAITLMETGRIAVGELITHTFPLERLSEGFEAMLHRSQSECIKAVVVPADRDRP